MSEPYFPPPPTYLHLPNGYDLLLSLKYSPIMVNVCAKCGSPQEDYWILNYQCARTNHYRSTTFVCQDCSHFNYTGVDALKHFMNGCEENSLQGVTFLSQHPVLLQNFTKPVLRSYLEFIMENYEMAYEDEEAFDDAYQTPQTSKLTLVNMVLDGIQKYWGLG